MNRDVKTSVVKRGLSGSASGVTRKATAWVLGILVLPGCVMDGHSMTMSGLFSKSEKSAGAAKMQSSPHVCPTCSAPMTVAATEGSGDSMPPVPTTSEPAMNTDAAAQPATTVPNVPMIPPESSEAQPASGMTPSNVSNSAGPTHPVTQVPAQPQQTPLPFQQPLGRQQGNGQRTWAENQAARAANEPQPLAVQQPQQTNSVSHPNTHQGDPRSVPHASVEQVPSIPAPAANFAESWSNNTGMTNQACPPSPVQSLQKCEERVQTLEQTVKDLTNRLDSTSGTLLTTLSELDETKGFVIKSQSLNLSLQRQNEELNKQMQELRKQQDQQLDLIEGSLSGDQVEDVEQVPQASSVPQRRAAAPNRVATRVSRSKSSAVTLPTVED